MLWLTSLCLLVWIQAAAGQQAPGCGSTTSISGGNTPWYGTMNGNPVQIRNRLTADSGISTNYGPGSNGRPDYLFHNVPSYLDGGLFWCSSADPWPGQTGATEWQLVINYAPPVVLYIWETTSSDSSSLRQAAVEGQGWTYMDTGSALDGDNFVRWRESGVKQDTMRVYKSPEFLSGSSVAFTVSGMTSLGVVSGLECTTSTSTTGTSTTVTATSTSVSTTTTSSSSTSATTTTSSTSMTTTSTSLTTTTTSSLSTTTTTSTTMSTTSTTVTSTSTSATTTTTTSATTTTTTSTVTSTTTSTTTGSFETAHLLLTVLNVSHADLVKDVDLLQGFEARVLACVMGALPAGTTDAMVSLSLGEDSMRLEATVYLLLNITAESVDTSVRGSSLLEDVTASVRSLPGIDKVSQGEIAAVDLEVLLPTSTTTTSTATTSTTSRTTTVTSSTSTRTTTTFTGEVAVITGGLNLQVTDGDAFLQAFRADDSIKNALIEGLAASLPDVDTSMVEITGVRLVAGRRLAGARRKLSATAVVVVSYVVRVPMALAVQSGMDMSTMNNAQDTMMQQVSQSLTASMPSGMLLGLTVMPAMIQYPPTTTTTIDYGRTADDTRVSIYLLLTASALMLSTAFLGVKLHLLHRPKLPKGQGVPEGGGSEESLAGRHAARGGERRKWSKDRGGARDPRMR